jgi:hypothetical protein
MLVKIKASTAPTPPHAEIAQSTGLGVGAAVGRAVVGGAVVVAAALGRQARPNESVTHVAPASAALPKPRLVLGPAPLPSPALWLLFLAIHGTVETHSPYHKEPRLDWLFGRRVCRPFMQFRSNDT